jgi:hypothetical protein
MKNGVFWEATRRNIPEETILKTCLFEVVKFRRLYGIPLPAKATEYQNEEETASQLLCNCKALVGLQYHNTEVNFMTSYCEIPN